MSATPISMLSKKILQYASTIDEAYRIAGEYRTFVSESIMVSSVKDGRAAVIEKTPSSMALYDPASSDSSVSRVVCTNHYQSDMFRDNPVNQENIRMSDSMRRYLRVEELLDSAGCVTPAMAASVLRDTRGLSGERIGYCNELAVNQLLAMHSVIFRPAERKIWVSTSPWQCGRFVCYDLDDVLASDFTSSVQIEDEAVPEDSFIYTREFADVLEFKRLLPEIQKAAASGSSVPDGFLEHFVALDSLYYNAYNVVGDYYDSVSRPSDAVSCWKKALTLPMKQSERERIIGKLEKHGAASAAVK